MTPEQFGQMVYGAVGQLSVAGFVLYVCLSLAVQIVVLSFLFWVGSLLVGIEGATFGRAMKATLLWLVLAALIIGVGYGGSIVLARLTEAPWAPLVLVSGCWLLVALAPLLTLRGAMETTLRKALATLSCSTGLVLVFGGILGPLVWVGIAAATAVVGTTTQAQVVP